MTVDQQPSLPTGPAGEPDPDAAPGGGDPLPGQRNQRRFRILWGVVLAVILGALSLSAATELATARRTAERAVSDSSLILKQHVLRQFEGADVVLRLVAAQVAADVPELGGRGADTDLAALSASASWILDLWVLNADGSRGFASRVPPPAMEQALASLQARAVDAPEGLMIGDPLDRTFATGSAMLVGRPIRAADGRHLGVAALTISGGDLADVFSHQVLGHDGAVGLIRADGVVLARYPALPGMVGRSIADTPVFAEIRRGADAGMVRVNSVSDAQSRIVSFARVGNLPLAVTAAYSTADIRGAALEAMKLPWAFGGLMILVLLALYPMVMRRLRAEERAARDLAEREMLFRSILNNVGIGLSLVARDGTIRFANTGFDRLLGFPPGGLNGRNIEDLTHPDDRLGTMYRVSRMEALGPTGVSYEKRYLRHDGSSVEAMVTLSLKPRVGTQEPLLVGVIQDLTEQRARERAIAFQNSLLRIQQEASPDGLLVADAGGGLRSCNRRFRDLWEVPEPLVEQGDVAAVLRHVAGAIAAAQPAAGGGVEPGWG
ncbi:PAS domain S-box protein, partial [Caenispirillum bisanense]|uniref:PAS domain S-box protein n=1 Tax=Caenispirillum bisanense TaxID=414052 RepID=UPI0031D93A06